MGQYALCFSLSLFDEGSKWGVDSFTDLPGVTYEVSSRQERKLFLMFRADSLSIYKRNPFWEVPYRNIPAPKNIRTRCEEKGMKSVTLGKNKVSSRVFVFMFLRSKQKNPGYTKSYWPLLSTHNVVYSWLMASPVYGRTTEKLINYLLCVLPPQISALMRHPAKSSVCLPEDVQVYLPEY